MCILTPCGSTLTPPCHLASTHHIFCYPSKIRKFFQFQNFINFLMQVKLIVSSIFLVALSYHHITLFSHHLGKFEPMNFSIAAFTEFFHTNILSNTLSENYNLFIYNLIYGPYNPSVVTSSSDTIV